VSFRVRICVCECVKVVLSSVWGCVCVCGCGWVEQVLGVLFGHWRSEGVMVVPDLVDAHAHIC
jgi:hypothetical protein